MRISSITMWNFLDQLGKHFFFVCVGGKQFETQEFFSHKMSRNLFDPILTMRDWKGPIVKNLRYLNSAVNEMI